MNPDQSSLIWVHFVCNICHQNTYAEKKAGDSCPCLIGVFAECMKVDWACSDPVKAQRVFGLDSADAGLEKIKNFRFLLKPNFITIGVITLLNFIKILYVIFPCPLLILLTLFNINFN